MRKVLQLLGAALAVLLLTFTVSGAVAETTHFKWNKSTSKGRPFNVAEHWDVHPDCSLRAYPSSKVVLPPKHGKIKIGRGKFKMNNKSAKSPYYNCKSLIVSGTTLQYTPEPNFTGKDNVKIRTRYSTGDIHDIDIVITGR